jgi:kynureninase
MALTPARLRETSIRQTTLLTEAIGALDIAPNVAEVVDIPAERRGGFVAIRTPHAAEIVPALRDRAVFVDARGHTLRLGPAPYVSDDQLHEAVAELADALRHASHNPSD